MKKTYFWYLLSFSFIFSAIDVHGSVVYREFERNRPAYRQGHSYYTGDYKYGRGTYVVHDNRATDVVSYRCPRDRVTKRTTRLSAERMGVPYRFIAASKHPRRIVTYYDHSTYDSYHYSSFPSSKRFYPNSEYEREVKIEQRRGLLTRVLEILL